MKKMTAVIVEDEPKAAEILNSMIKENFSDIEVCDTVHNATNAFHAIIRRKPDMVFMDIRLGEETAFDILKRFEGVDFQLVFTSAYDEYAIKAFDYPSPQFVVKPIQLDKLYNVIGRVRQNLGSKHLNESETLYTKGRSTERLAFSSASTTELIDFAEIEFLAAEGSYTALHLTDGTKRISSKILGHYQKSLKDERFFRVHRKFIVNLDHIVRYDKSKAVTLHLSSGMKIQCSVVYKSKLLNTLKERLTF